MMGLLVDGKWQDKWYDTAASKGRFVRSQSQFRNWITVDGSAGSTGNSGFKAESGRYHIYASYACPWAHRVLIYRQIKGLENSIDVSFVHWLMAENGWTFQGDDDGIVSDKLYGKEFLHQLYTKALADYSGRVTVPILWDKQQQTIVSNESADIIRMLNSSFVDAGANSEDYYPVKLQAEIDELNARIYDRVNNGVYKAGFATTQHAYDEAVVPLFETLDYLDERLADSRFLLGDRPTEADWRLFPTLLRFDPIYHTHFKCNLKRIADYPHLSRYTKEIYLWPGIKQTINLPHAINHYYQSHRQINPYGIVPINKGTL